MEVAGAGSSTQEAAWQRSGLGRRGGGADRPSACSPRPRPWTAPSLRPCWPTWVACVRRGEAQEAGREAAAEAACRWGRVEQATDCMAVGCCWSENSVAEWRSTEEAPCLRCTSARSPMQHQAKPPPQRPAALSIVPPNNPRPHTQPAMQTASLCRVQHLHPGAYLASRQQGASPLPAPCRPSWGGLARRQSRGGAAWAAAVGGGSAGAGGRAVALLRWQASFHAADLNALFTSPSCRRPPPSPPPRPAPPAARGAAPSRAPTTSWLWAPAAPPTAGGLCRLPHPLPALCRTTAPVDSAPGSAVKPALAAPRLLCRQKKGGFKDTPADDLIIAVLQGVLARAGVQPQARAPGAGPRALGARQPRAAVPSIQCAPPCRSQPPSNSPHRWGTPPAGRGRRVLRLGLPALLQARLRAALRHHPGRLPRQRARLHREQVGWTPTAGALGSLQDPSPQLQQIWGRGSCGAGLLGSP